MYFETAAISCNPCVPIGIAFCLSFVCSMGGISGGFLLLPFQMSILGYTHPSVSATNHLFNIIACPAGVLRYAREGRLLWPIALAIAIGTLPGVFIGALIRVTLLPDPKAFTVFAGGVLLYIGCRMAQNLWQHRTKELSLAAQGGQKSLTLVSGYRGRIAFRFQEHLYFVPKGKLALLSAVVGLIGGIYGIGGGAIMAPFLVSFFAIPVYVVAGATLMATAITSLGGVLCFAFLGQFYPALSVAPDWLLGLLLGLGGMLGMYVGARCQKFVRATVIKTMLTLVVLGMGLAYLF